ncbi:MAG: UDP-2,4-diacetamido-2,4,6-trideoxy-beta-L-altropyranose hydrolase [bacterium]
MLVIFRVDASIQIGSGHVMRCLTLADALKNEGVNCTFICREHSGNMLALIQSKEHGVVALPIKEADTSLSSQHPRQEYLSWLGAAPNEDAEQTIAAIQSLAVDKPAWLIVDHYALDRDWEKQLRPHCQKIMVIDDLADRKHDCDLLLDQTFGRDERDYQTLVPEHCTILTGSYYALLRPEFAQWRAYSLQRRQQPQLKQLLITLGGVDKDNVTRQVLTALANSQLPNDCHITIVMGEHAPWLESIKAQAQQLPWSTEVKVNVTHMAELMANSDLCIGAAGNTTWERCCLGLPTIMLVLAENQRKIADELDRKDITYIIYHVIKITHKLNTILTGISSELYTKTEKSSIICDGLGTKIIRNHLGGSPFIRRMKTSDLQLVRQWRNHPSVRACMFNQNEIDQDEHEQWFLEKSRQQNQFLLLFENQGKPQGFISFNVKDNLEADWGFYKAPNSPRGTGKLLGHYVLDYAFKKVGLDKVNAQVIQYNQGSLTFHQKLGFLEEKTIKGGYSDGKTHYDIIYFSLPSKTWLKIEHEQST